MRSRRPMSSRRSNAERTLDERSVAIDLVRWARYSGSFRAPPAPAIGRMASPALGVLPRDKRVKLPCAEERIVSALTIGVRPLISQEPAQRPALRAVQERNAPGEV